MICLSETYIFNIENDVKACFGHKIEFISDFNGEKCEIRAIEPINYFQ